MQELRRRNVCRVYDPDASKVVVEALDDGRVDYVIVLGNFLVRHDQSLVAKALISKILNNNNGYKKTIKLL